MWSRFLVLAKGPRETVIEGLHDVLEKCAFAGFDEDIGGHSRRRPEPLDLAPHVIFVKPNAHDEAIAVCLGSIRPAGLPNCIGL